jgi:hypothetical protein
MVNQLLHQCFTLSPAAFFRSHVSETTAYPFSLTSPGRGVIILASDLLSRSSTPEGSNNLAVRLKSGIQISIHGGAFEHTYLHLSTFYYTAPPGPVGGGGIAGARIVAPHKGAGR